MKRILFVDDDIERLTSLLELVGEAGFDVLSANTVTSGLRIVEEQAGSLAAIVVDMVMPHEALDPYVTGLGLRTGLVLIEKLKQLAPSVPLLVFTVIHDPQTKAAALKAGAAAYIEKPVLSDVLISEIKRLL